MSVATSRQGEVEGIRLDIPEGMNIPCIPGESLTLRKAREKYAQLVPRRVGSKKDSQFPEIYDTRNFMMYPMYLTARSARGKLCPLLTPMTPATLLHYRTRLQQRPWTFLPLADELSHESSALGERIMRTPTPLTAYTYDAQLEATYEGAAKYYVEAYAKMEMISIYTGLYGVMHINQVIHMNCGDNIHNPDMKLRAITPDQMMFICAGHTAHSTQAGLVRRVCHGVEMRLWSLVEWDSFSRELSLCITDTGRSKFVVVVGGLYTYTDEKSVQRLRVAYNEGRLALATLREIQDSDGTIIYIDVTPGVLLRKIGSAWYDSISVPRRTGYPLNHYFSTFFLTVPYIMRNRPPRTLLASCQSIQAMCQPYLLQDAVYKPHDVKMPLVVSRYVRDMGIDTRLIPGVNVKLAAINVNDNYEDAFLLSEAAIKSGMFKYSLTHTLTIRSDQVINVGDRISKETHDWWFTPFDATVVQVDPVNAERQRIVLYRESVPSDGDKMATLHGQKGVIVILSEDKMPKGYDKATGQVEHFDIVIAASSILSRVTMGQICEMRMGRVAMDRGVQMVEDELTIPELFKLPNLHVYDEHTKGALLAPDGREVMCEWGYCRIVQLHHLTSKKHHYTRLKQGVHSKSTVRGATDGGSLNLGSMETEAMASTGLTHTLNELCARRGMSKVSVCCKCNRQCMLCDCADANNPTRQMSIPFDTLRLDIISMLTNGSSFEYFPDRVGI